MVRELLDLGMTMTQIGHAIESPKLKLEAHNNKHPLLGGRNSLIKENS
jgi:hypothetical protein